VIKGSQNIHTGPSNSSSTRSYWPKAGYFPEKQGFAPRWHILIFAKRYS
jgi:hypothetical protein